MDSLAVTLYTYRTMPATHCCNPSITETQYTTKYSTTPIMTTTTQGSDTQELTPEKKTQ